MRRLIVGKSSKLVSKNDNSEGNGRDLKLCEEELAKLGVTPENAKEELERLAAEIEKELQEIDDSIPVDMLRALKRI